jgi:hypothetical protein
MTHHRDMLVQTSTALANHDKAVVAFVKAAEAISTEYRGADALSSAKVGDVDTQLNTPPPAAASSITQPVVTPQQAQAQTEQPVTTGSPDDGGKEFK